MVVTSGLRSLDQQQQLIAAGKSNAPKSHHLTGEAVDIYDPDGKLYQYCLDSIPLLEQCELWCEIRQGAWVHFQIVPPKSGKRFLTHD
jgi:aryl carrier-like protein